MKMNAFKRGLVLSFVLGTLAVSGIAVQADGMLLKQGMENDEVKQVQLKLKALGYFNETATGYFGEVTKQAVERYQRDRNFTPDGVVGSATWSALVGSATYSKASGSLELGDEGDRVKTLQTKLNSLGYFNEAATGYFGQVTENAVKKFQRAKGLNADGVVGAATWNKLFNGGSSANSSSTARTSISRSSQSGDSLVPWDEAKNIFRVGTVATVIDIGTGVKFSVKRTMGYNHADTETISTDDTRKMKEVFGGSWGWERRPIVLVVDGRWLAASMSGMPHAGLDDEPSYEVVSGRSGGFGTGQNLDTVKGNGMNGHFDIHFLYSRTHGTNKIDPAHQDAVKRAAKYISSR